MSDEKELPLEDEHVEDIEGIEFELPDTHAEIASACNVYNTVAEIDLTLLDKKKAKQIKQMRQWSLDILHFHMQQLHADIIGEGAE